MKKPVKKSKAEAVPQRKAMAMSLPTAQVAAPVLAPSAQAPLGLKKGGKVCSKS